MHPRNIYKVPPDFSALAIKYPEFLKISMIDLNGTVRINFQDKNSLRVLTKCLLHSDFGLNVDIPENRLVPTIPLRLNYLLWLEDILNDAGKMKDICGIDIGTGACCVYPLLAATKFKWKMLATEVDENSVNMALKNVKQNLLGDYITVKMVEGESQLLLHCFVDYGGILENADFCMCNPPFYSSLDDMDQSRSPLRAPPRNARTGSLLEVVTAGGEVTFVKKLIEESKILKTKIRIFTTMLGHKSSLKPLLKVLEKNNITQVSHTVFCQGRTTRWGLAWSFLESSKLSTQLPPKSGKQNKCMSFAIPQLEGIAYTVKDITIKLLQILKILDIKTKLLQQKDVITTIELTASRNTWSNQRRRRREHKLSVVTHDQEKNSIATSSTLDIQVDNTDSNTHTHLEGKPLSDKPRECNEKTLKRDNDESFTQNKSKIFKMDSETPISSSEFDSSCGVSPSLDCDKNIDINELIGESTNNNKTLFSEEIHVTKKKLPASPSLNCEDNTDNTFLRAALSIRNFETYIILEIGYVSGSAGKDGVHQIVQYIKNNWK